MPSISALVDTFDSFDSAKWPNSYGDYSVTGGKGRIVTTPNVFGGFMTAASYSVPDGAALSARVVVNALNGATTDCYAAMRIMPTTPSGTDFGMMADRISGNLVCENRVNYDDAAATSVAFSSTSMAFWRIRRSGSNILCETAPEASEGTPGTWTTRRTVAVPSWMSTATNLTVLLEAYRNNGTAGNVDWDYINTGFVAPTGGKGNFLMFP